MRNAPRPADFARADFLGGVGAWRLWLGLGLQDIRIRYQRTVLGPWWITASQAATFICMGMLFSAVLKNDVRNYLPYLAAGMVTWSFVGAMAQDGPQIFLGARNVITQLPVPLVVHVLRAGVRNIVIFLHNASAAVVAFVVLGGELDAHAAFLLISVPLLFVTASAGALVLAIVGSRFRDLGPLVSIAVQLGFFMTPIMWRPEDIPDGSKWWVTANPAYHLVEIVRAPMLGATPDPASLAVAAALAVVLGGTAYLLFLRLRHRIAYWL